MKNYKQILEAVNRGIKFALDDFEDNELQGQTNSKVSHQHGTKEYLEYLDLMNIVVDLGLPSGTLWCKYNLGCDFDLLNNHPEQSNSEDWYGDYYAWGELEPNKLKYDWSNYKFSDELFHITKYKLNDEPKLTELQPEDDAAYQNIHFYDFKFHIPTKEQFEELLEYTEQYTAGKYYKEELNLNGILFISKINRNSIFIPTAGYYENEKIRNLSQGWYLSSSLFANDKYVDCLSIVDDRAKLGITNREEGACIRPVINL